jgi:hypothetical protein
MIPAALRAAAGASAVAGLGLLALAVPAATAAGPDPASGAWRHDPLWDDGRAEMCAYEVEWARYGRLYPGRALLVLVKEPWAPELDVKADAPRADGFDVLKLNHLRDVPTGIYTYHQMASVFLRRDDGSLRKLAATSAEACGTSTAQLTGGELAVSTYFDGIGSWRRPWPEGAWAEDGLAASLRDLVAGEPPADLLVYPSLLDGRLPPREARRVAVERRRVGEVAVPWGTADAVDLVLRDGADISHYRFEAAAPHRLLALELADGTTYRVARCDRLAYWTMHDPADADWWPERLR